MEFDAVGIDMQSGMLQDFDVCSRTDQNRLGFFVKLLFIDIVAKDLPGGNRILIINMHESPKYNL